jgi:hypothetical protein
MQDQKSFIGYKKDQRGILEVSPLKNENYQEKLKQRYENLKSKLKYRLYGAEGVTNYEIRKLVSIGEIEKKNPFYPLPEDDEAMKMAIHLNTKGNKGFKI